MNPKTIIPAGFADVVPCDYVAKYGCLIILAPSVPVAHAVCDDMERIQRWLSRKAPWIDGCFIDGLDGDRHYAFQASWSGRWPQTYPFDCRGLSLYAAIALGRVSPLPTWITQDDTLIYSNQDADGGTTSIWTPDSIYLPDAVAGRIPMIQEVTWQGQSFEIVQFLPVGVDAR